MSIAQVHRVVLQQVRKLTAKKFAPSPSQENFEIAWLWLKAVAKLAVTRIRQQENMLTLRELGAARGEALAQVPDPPAADKRVSPAPSDVSSLCDSLWFSKAGCGLKFVTSTVDILPDGCTQYDPKWHNLREMSVMGQLSQTLPTGEKIVVWILSAQSDDLPGVRSAFTSASHDVIHIEEGSPIWKQKFQYRSLVRDLISYADWHLEQVGESPGKRLSSILRVGSPMPLQDQDLLVAADVIDSSMSLESVSAAFEWFQSCVSPAAAMSGIISMLVSRLLRAFKQWTTVSMWSRALLKRPAKCFLLCGDVEWTAAVARENCEKEGYWDAEGEVTYPQPERLKVMGGTDEFMKIIHTKPTAEDYSKRGLQLHERLMGEHVRLMPENFVVDDAVYDTVLAEAVNNEKKWLGDFFDDSPIVTKVEDSDSGSEGEEDSFLVLYLANDFHWRGGQYLEMSGAGLALVRFNCRDKDVQISRCIFPESEEYHRKVNTLACVQDFIMRGLKLPYGYQLEMILLRYSRMQAVKRLKASFKVWAVIKPQASLDAVQYTESRIVEALPDYPRMTSNVQAKALQEVGLEIISMVSWEYDM